jgi:4-hydroxybenzoate polyprenyltransferase
VTTRASNAIAAGWLPNGWRSVRGYLLLPHLAPILLVVTAVVVFAVIAWGGEPPLGLLAQMIVAVLGGQLAIGAINEIVDLADDQIHKPSKPLPRGDVPMRGAKAMVVVGLGMMALFGACLGPLSFGLLLLGTGLGIAYDLKLKRTRWSWLPYLLALPLLPIWVFLTLDRPQRGLMFLYPLGALAAIGVHFAQALPDVQADRDAGLVTPTSQLGARGTFLVAWLAALSAPLLAWGAAERIGSHSAPAAIVIALMLSLVLAAVNGALFAASRRLGALACFPMITLSTLASGVVWTLTQA